jgi:iron complex outermembrane receptor protein
MQARIPTILLLLFSPLMLIAQPGTVKGTILDNNTKEALIGATVLLDGTTFGGAADISGNYVINKVPAGTYVAVNTTRQSL